MATDFPSLGWAAIDWIEHYLVHGPGDVQGKPIELDDEYAAFVVKAYRVRPRTGEKVVRRAFLSRPKGRAKSELAGMLNCFEALGPCRFDHWAKAGEVSDWGYAYEPGEPVGKPLVYVEILCVATEEGQAGNTFDNTYHMLHADTCSPELLADFGKLDVGLTRINMPNRRGYIEPVTAANESKDGGKSTFIVADETHLWLPPAVGRFKLGLMHQTMARNLLKRKLASGWMLETSTMYAEGEGSVAEGTHAYAKSKAARNGKLLFDHKQAGDDYDLTKRRDRIAALREVYGPAASWMPLTEIADAYDDPQVNPNEWRRFWLNQPVPLEEPVVESTFGPGRWEACATEAKFPDKPDAIGVAVSVDRLTASIAAACVLEEIEPEDDDEDAEPAARVFVAAVERRGDLGWLVAEVARIQQEHDCSVVIDAKGPAGELLDEFDKADVAVEAIDLNEYSDACARFFDKVRAELIEHPSSRTLNDAVNGAAWRFVGDRRVWGRKNSLGDVSMLEAATLAAYGAEEFGVGIW